MSTRISTPRRRRCALLLPLLAAAALSLGPAPVGRAADVPTLGPLAAEAVLGDDGTWRALVEDGAFVWINTRRPEAIRYLSIEADHPLDVSVQVAIDTQLSPTLVNGAGLIYAVQGEGPERIYYAVLREPEGRIGLYVRDAGGFRQLLTQQPEKLDGEMVALSLRETGSGVEIAANGTTLGWFDAPGAGAGGVGIIAAGLGRFAFRHFSVVAATEAIVANPPPPGDAPVRAGILAVPSLLALPSRREPDDQIDRAEGEPRR